MNHKISTPLKKDTIKNLNVGDIVSLTGYIYTARDSAHKKIIELIDSGKELPFDLKDQVIYYVGPCPKKPGKVIGSAGPTTSSRMDAYSPNLLDLGLSGMIGKGQRNKEVVDSIVKNNAIYFGAIGGIAALIAKSIESEEIIAFEELGTEAVRKLFVKDFPVTVIIDSKGNNLYENGKEQYKQNS